jgi:hypothetical protein
MTNLECLLLRLTDQHDAERFFALAPAALESAYNNGSRGAIRMTVSDLTDLIADDPFADGQGDRHFAADLHVMLRRFVPNLRDRRTEKIAVLYGGFYAHHEAAFGVMFDAGYLPEAAEFNINNPLVEGRPREGCAVFLGAIAKARARLPGPELDDFDRQVLFTTIHELGHVFNLEHVRNPVNYPKFNGHARNPFQFIELL